MSKATKLRAIANGEAQPKQKHKNSSYIKRKGYLVKDGYPVRYTGKWSKI